VRTQKIAYLNPDFIDYGLPRRSCYRYFGPSFRDFLNRHLSVVRLLFAAEFGACTYWSLGLD